jgi:hypothetical protein
VVDAAGPAGIDAPWLTEVLQRAGVAKGATVTDVDFLGWIGTGQTGRNGRFALEWDRPEDRPPTVVGKFPSDDDTARATGFLTGSYLREFLFYDGIAATVGIRVPQCHHCSFDAARQDFVILMEDAVGAVQGDQLDGLSRDQVALGIEQAVALHAPRSGEEGLDALLVAPGDPVPSADESAQLMQMFYGMTMVGFLDRLGGRLDPDVVEVVEALAPQVGRWMHGTGGPTTLVHLDFRADNLLFGAGPDATPLTVVDWQTLGVGSGATDVAYLVSGSFPDRTERAATERSFVDDYRARMGAAGVDLDAEQLWHEYRLGSLWGLVITVLASMAAEHTARGDDMFCAMAQRHGWQAIDLEAISLLA